MSILLDEDRLASGTPLPQWENPPSRMLPRKSEAEVRAEAEDAVRIGIRGAVVYGAVLVCTLLAAHFFPGHWGRF